MRSLDRGCSPEQQIAMLAEGLIETPGLHRPERLCGASFREGGAPRAPKAIALPAPLSLLLG